MVKCKTKVTVYDAHHTHTDIGVPGEHQRLNASLAVQLCRRWLIENNRWKDFSTVDSSVRPSEGVSKFSDGLPTPFKDGNTILIYWWILSLMCRY